MARPDQSSAVRITFAPLANNLRNVVMGADGTWGWVRIVHRYGTARGGQPDIFNIELTNGSYKVSLVMRVTSVDNPFHRDLFSGFYCLGQM